MGSQASFHLGSIALKLMVDEVAVCKVVEWWEVAGSSVVAEGVVVESLEAEFGRWVFAWSVGRKVDLYCLGSIFLGW